MPEPAASKRHHADPLAKFPEDVRQAYQRYLSTNDAEAVDIVVLAVVRDFIPKKKPVDQEQSLSESARLMQDLGFDSLAIAETVFFLEDLFKVTISNQEIMQVSTIGELRAFVRHKLAGKAAR